MAEETHITFEEAQGVILQVLRQYKAVQAMEVLLSHGADLEKRLAALDAAHAEQAQKHERYLADLDGIEKREQAQSEERMAKVRADLDSLTEWVRQEKEKLRADLERARADSGQAIADLHRQKAEEEKRLGVFRAAVAQQAEAERKRLEEIQEQTRQALAAHNGAAAEYGKNLADLRTKIQAAELEHAALLARIRNLHDSLGQLAQ